MLDYYAKNRFLSVGHNTSLYLLWQTLLALWPTCLLSMPLTGAAQSKSPPTVIMLEIPGVTTNDDTLNEAIRAQLSAASLRLDRLTVDNPQSLLSDPVGSVSKLSADHGAVMSFWIIENGTTYTIFFYSQHASEPRISTRALDLVSESQVSRCDTIGNAVSSIVEESISTVGGARARDASPPPPARTPSPPPPPHDGKRKWVNLFMGYSGSLFARQSVTHGVHMGLGLLPMKHLAIALSYTPSLPSKWETTRYKLTLLSRNVAMSIAGRLLTRFLEIRAGFAWSVDLRSSAMSSYTDTIAPRPEDLAGIHSLIPFAAAIWTVADWFGIAAGLGADIAINEKSYLILRDDGQEVFVMEPFTAKLTYQMGVIFQL